jgi:recombination protein RecR
MEYPTKLVENAVAQIAKLPGIGPKSALRLALHMLRRPVQEATDLAQAIEALRLHTTYCQTCHHIADTQLCSICTNPRRDATLLCIVETSRDVMAIESTAQYSGLYHVLGGVISPLDGIGPEDINMASLLARFAPDAEPSIHEVILALGATVEAETTGFYIQRKAQANAIKVTSLARGIPVGGELEYADEQTLARSIAQRIAY